MASTAQNRIQLRDEMEHQLRYTNTIGFRVLEYGAETKYVAARIVDDFVQIITTNPFHWHLVQLQRENLTKVLKRITKFFVVENSFKVHDKNSNTLTKIQFLEEELTRLQQEMMKMKDLSDTLQSPVQSKEKSSSPQFDEESDPEMTPSREKPNDEQLISIKKFPIPLPPPLPQQPLYHCKDKEPMELSKPVYTRRLPPTNSFSSAIRMGAAIKLRKVEGPRSPGGTPKMKLMGQEKLSNSLSEALDAKFKNALHTPPSSPGNKDWDVDDVSDKDKSKGSVLSSETFCKELRTFQLRSTHKVKEVSAKSATENPLLAAINKSKQQLKKTKPPSTNESCLLAAINAAKAASEA